MTWTHINGKYTMKGNDNGDITLTVGYDDEMKTYTHVEMDVTFYVGGHVWYLFGDQDKTIRGSSKIFTPKIDYLFDYYPVSHREADTWKRRATEEASKSRVVEVMNYETYHNNNEATLVDGPDGTYISFTSGNVIRLVD